MVDPKIFLKEIISDIQAGLGDVRIMEKYGLTPGQLLGILKKLKQAEDEAAVRKRHKTGEATSPARRRERRSIPRYHMLLNTSVHDLMDPSIHGTVVDVSEKGMKIEGLAATEQETRHFFIAFSDDKTIDSPLLFDAVCRWSSQDGATCEPMSGFEITEISKESLEQLRTLIEQLGVKDAGPPSQHTW